MTISMQCTDVQRQIDTRVPAGVPLDTEARAHLRRCELCRHRYGDAALDQLLRSQPVPPPTPGFIDIAIRNAVHQDRSPQRTVIAALAASLVALAVAVGLHFNTESSGPVQVDSVESAPAMEPMVHVTLTPQQAKTVRVLINSVDHHDSATITVALAENLELEGYPDDQIIEWQASLEPGNNLLALPLRLKSPEASYFDVTLSHGQTRKQLRVDVAVAVISSSSTRSVI